MAWSPANGEEVIHYDPRSRGDYEAGRPSDYDPWEWPAALRRGRNTHGCFPEVAARAHYERQGYRVLVSEPNYPGDGGYLLFHYAGKRRSGDAAFRRMQGHFPGHDLNELAELAQKAKRDAGLKGGGGDPDLFVFRPDGSERFFVEVKDKDELHANQLLCFPIIERHLNCPVRVVRVEPMPPSGGDA